MTVPADSLSPTALEIAAGIPVGRLAGGRVRAPSARGEAPLEALRSVVAPALAAGPCFVSFSGGRDSSVVLAAAAAVARERSLAPPIPVTLRFPGLEESDETAWQERVVAHLGLLDWERIDCAGGEVDALGPYAQAALRRHGVMWPPNGCFHSPMLERARGGTLLSGIGGDVLFSSWRWRETAAALARRRRPRPRDLLTAAKMAAPPRVRAVLDARRQPPAPPWVREPYAGEYVARLVAQRATHPRSFSRYPAWLATLRYVALGSRTQTLLAADAGCSALDPLLDPGFLAAVGRAGGRFGFGSRSHAMRELFGALLPRDVLERTTKAVFNAATWGEASRKFAAGWDGGGLDPALVDADALRAAWSRGPDIRTLMALQQAWLHADRTLEAA